MRPFRSASDRRVLEPERGMDEDSVQPTDVRSIWRAIGFVLVLLVISLSLTPRPIAIPIEHGDKLDHLAAYATLMFWFAQLDTRHRKRLAYAIGFVSICPPRYTSSATVRSSRKMPGSGPRLPDVGQERIDVFGLGGG